MFRNVRGLFLAMVMVMLCTVTVNATKASTLISFRVDSEPIKCFYTEAKTVAEFFEEQGITLEKEDKLSVDIGAPIVQDMKIEWQQRMLVHVVTDGETNSRYTVSPNVASLVAEVKQETGLEYAYDYDLWNDEISSDYVLALSTAKAEIEVSKKEIPFESIIEYDETISLGITEVLQPGITGEITISTEVSYLGGSEISREVVEEITSIMPQQEIIKEGTAEVISEEIPYQFTAKYTMNASAYTADYNSTGKSPGDRGFGITASGMKARVGVVAVDPKVIPLGTELYIEGYGLAIAGDTGGAIKGLKIDLYFDTNSECKQFGRRDIVVWVLK